MRLRNVTRRGFTAVEIAMVASVIAILALLVLPIFRDRAESARVVAAQDELQSFAKALLLVEADLPGGGYLVQLSDLDQPALEGNNLTGINGGYEPGYPPRISWNRLTGRFEEVTDQVYLNSVLVNWKGPYIAFPRGGANGLPDKLVPLAGAGFTIQSAFAPLTNLGANQGPIAVPDASYFEDSYPLDPWGTPYLLFGAGETIYSSRVLFSLGPNGVPGNSTGVTAAQYSREGGLLGTGDDLEYKF